MAKKKSALSSLAQKLKPSRPTLIRIALAVAVIAALNFASAAGQRNAFVSGCVTGASEALSMLGLTPATAPITQWCQEQTK